MILPKKFSETNIIIPEYQHICYVWWACFSTDTIVIATDRTVNRCFEPKDNTIFIYRQEKIRYARTIVTSRGQCYQTEYT
jgi:hypothetical protein